MKGDLWLAMHTDLNAHLFTRAVIFFSQFSCITGIIWLLPCAVLYHNKQETSLWHLFFLFSSRNILLISLNYLIIRLMCKCDVLFEAYLQCSWAFSLLELLFFLFLQSWLSWHSHQELSSFSCSPKWHILTIFYRPESNYYLNLISDSGM